MEILFIFTSDFNCNFNMDYIMDFIVDFICGFYGFHMKSTWFHMKDHEKVKNLTWISFSYWFQVDFIKSVGFHEICQISEWNPPDFMKSADFIVKSSGFQCKICWISVWNLPDFRFQWNLPDFMSFIRKTTCQGW